MTKQFKLFDSHFHIIDSRFPLVANQGYLPDSFTLADYQQRLADYSLCGGALVSGSFQAYNQDYLLTTLKQLGETFVGVTQLPTDVCDQEIVRLNENGVRAIRFNLKRGDQQARTKVLSLATRAHRLAGWHSEFYIDVAELEDWYSTLISLPAISIDHLGLSKAGFKSLLQLVERGAKVKATGFGRTDLNIQQALLEIHAVNPEALMFGTDLPSTRSPNPYCDRDYRLVLETFDQTGAQAILSQNAFNFYHRGNYKT